MNKQIKKPAVDLTDLAMGIIILGIVVSIGAIVLIGVRDARLTDLDVITTFNETITASDGGTDLTNTWAKAITTVTNATGGETIDSGNYTFTIGSVGGTGNIDWLGTSSYNSSSVNVTYTWYNTSRVDFNTADDAVTGLGEYGNWFKIIVIVGVAAVVLAIIFMSFGKKSFSEAQGISY